MAEREPRIFLDGQTFPEGPRWHNNRLYFSDIHAHQVTAVDMQGKTEVVARVPNKPSGLGWLPDGRMLVVSMMDKKLNRLDPDGLKVVADLGEYFSGHANDMVVDRQGRAYIGNTGGEIWSNPPTPSRPTSIVMVTPDGKARVVAREMVGPNGMVITPDGRTLIVAEPGATRLTAFTIGADGSLGNQRVWAQMEGPPDGIAIDAERCVWAGVPREPGKFLRLAEGGQVKQRIEVSDRRGIACALGGPGRKTLFLLESFKTSPDSQKGNGRIRTVEVDVGGAGWP
ncbi:MAG: SMP-30/gluconolactonase/LRE family protein [SAR202 cluster bacterium]|nr:SMP-30/gluconolactonase/LRE family protein [SAR202 cluster bacterium]